MNNVEQIINSQTDSGGRNRISRFIALAVILTFLFSIIPTIPTSSARTTHTDIDFFVTEIPDTVGGGFEPHVIAGPGIDGKEWIYVDSPTGLGSGDSGNLWITRDSGQSWEFKPKDPFMNFGSSGDSYTAISKEGYIYYTDLYLATAAIQTSLDGGETWLQNPVASEYVLDDRQWLVIGPSASPTAVQDQTVYFAFNQIPAGLVMLRSELSGTAMEWIPCNGGVPITFNGGYRDYFDVDQNDGTIYCPNGEGGGIYVYTSTDGGNTFDRTVVEGAEKGQNIFISVAVDSAGNVYLVWSKQDHIWMAVSRDKAQSWKVHQVTNTRGTRVLPWVTAGDEGRIAMVWYGTTAEGNSNNNDDMQDAMWDIECAISIDVLVEEPEFIIATVEKDVHGGTISTGGLGGGADRDIGDFFTCDVDETGRMITAYGKDGDDGPNQRNAVVMFARQIDGPYLLENAGPVANFTASTYDLEVRTDASNSVAPGGGEIVQYNWEWGDGTSSNTSEPTESHTYGSDGSYNITLTVLDSNEMSGKTTAPVSVEEGSEGFIESIGGTPVVGGITFGLILLAVLLVMLGRKQHPGESLESGEPIAPQEQMGSEEYMEPEEQMEPERPVEPRAPVQSKSDERHRRHRSSKLNKLHEPDAPEEPDGIEDPSERSDDSEETDVEWET